MQSSALTLINWAASVGTVTAACAKPQNAAYSSLRDTCHMVKSRFEAAPRPSSEILISSATLEAVRYSAYDHNVAASRSGATRFEAVTGSGWVVGIPPTIDLTGWPLSAWTVLPIDSGGRVLPMYCHCATAYGSPVLDVDPRTSLGEALPWAPWLTSGEKKNRSKLTQDS